MVTETATTVGSAAGLIAGVMFAGLYLVFGVGALWMIIKVIIDIFNPNLTIKYDPRQIKAFENQIRKVGIDLNTGKLADATRGTGGANDDESEWRYRASGGYGGEFMDDIADGTGLDLDYRPMGTDKARS